MRQSPSFAPQLRVPLRERDSVPFQAEIFSRLKDLAESLRELTFCYKLLSSKENGHATL